MSSTKFRSTGSPKETGARMVLELEADMQGGGATKGGDRANGGQSLPGYL